MCVCVCVCVIATECVAVWLYVCAYGWGCVQLTSHNLEFEFPTTSAAAADALTYG